MVWRCIVHRVATLQEIDQWWDICDLYDANEALDIQDEAKRMAADQ